MYELDYQASVTYQLQGDKFPDLEVQEMDQQTRKGESTLDHPSTDQDAVSLDIAQVKGASIEQLSRFLPRPLYWWHKILATRSPLPEGGFSFQVKHVNEA